MNPTHIKVTAPEGKLTPIGRADGTLPGGGLLHVRPGTICRVRYSQDIRRSINRGDLVACNMDGADVGVHLDDAAAPDELEGGIIDLSARKSKPPILPSKETK